MSAVPKPDPDSPPEPADVEGWALLEGLRRRLDDQAVQGRKTQQQVTQLAESIGALVETQRRRARWLNLNSFVAYLIFTLLCGAGFYFLYTSRASELVGARDAARRERDTAVRRADDATTTLAAREQAETRAWEVYELLESGKRVEATTKLAALGALPLSKTERTILAARAHETQVMEVDAALKAAALAFKTGRHAAVIPQLEAALVGEPAGPRASSMRYFLGVAYAKSAQLDKAIANLTIALAVEAEHEDVRFQLASALDRSGAWGKARVEYSRFATAHPVSSFAAFAMRRSATLARMPAQAPAKPAAPTPSAPESPTPSPPAPAAPVSPTPAPTPSLPPAPSTPSAPKQPALKPRATPAAPKPVAPATTESEAPKREAPTPEAPTPESTLPPPQAGSGTSMTTPASSNAPSPMSHLEPLDGRDQRADRPAKPGAAKPDAAKPDAAKPDAAKPGADKPGGNKPSGDKTADRDKPSGDKTADRDKPSRDKPSGDKTADRDKPRDPLPPKVDPPSSLPSTPSPEPWPSKPPPPDRTPPPGVAAPKPPPPPSGPPIERVASE